MYSPHALVDLFGPFAQRIIRAGNRDAIFRPAKEGRKQPADVLLQSYTHADLIDRLGPSMSAAFGSARSVAAHISLRAGVGIRSESGEIWQPADDGSQPEEWMDQMAISTATRHLSALCVLLQTHPRGSARWIGPQLARAAGTDPAILDTWIETPEMVPDSIGLASLLIVAMQMQQILFPWCGVTELVALCGAPEAVPVMVGDRCDGLRTVDGRTWDEEWMWDKVGLSVFYFCAIMEGVTRRIVIRRPPNEETDEVEGTPFLGQWNRERGVFVV